MRFFNCLIIFKFIQATAAVVMDGDTAWFNNPQYRLQTAKPCQLYISVLASSAVEGDVVHVISITVTSMPKTSPCASHPHLWDSSTVDIVASLRPDGRLKGQEASVWALNLDPANNYHVVVHTLRRGLEGTPSS